MVVAGELEAILGALLEDGLQLGEPRGWLLVSQENEGRGNFSPAPHVSHLILRHAVASSSSSPGTKTEAAQNPAIWRGGGLYGCLGCKKCENSHGLIIYRCSEGERQGTSGNYTGKTPWHCLAIRTDYWCKPQLISTCKTRFGQNKACKTRGLSPR